MTKFYYRIVTREELSAAAGGPSYITSEGHSELNYSNYTSNYHYKICDYCSNNAVSRSHKVGNNPVRIYPLEENFFVSIDKLVNNDNDIFYQNKTIYVAFTIRGVANPYSDGGSTATLTNVSTSVMNLAAGSHDIPITGSISMSYCGDNSYIYVDDTKYLKNDGSNQDITTGAKLKYVSYHGYSLSPSSGASTEFACTMLYKVVFSSSLSLNPAEIYRTSIKNDSKIVLTLSTDISNLDYRIEFSGLVNEQNDEASGGNTNRSFYYFYITQRAFSNGEISDAKYALTITLNRGRYPFSYNFSVLGNKILPANKNYYLCKTPARANSEILNGEIIDFYFLQNYENDMTPSSCEVDIMYDSSGNENVAYVPSGSAAVYLTKAPENFVYPIFKNESNELVHYTTFLDNLKKVLD